MSSTLIMRGLGWMLGLNSALGLSSSSTQRSIGSGLAGLILAAGVAHGTDYPDHYAPGQCILDLSPGHTIEEINLAWGTTTVDSFPPAGLYLIYAGPWDMEAYADSMVAYDPGIEAAEANYYEETPEALRGILFVAVGGTVSDYEDQALTDRIGLDLAHAWSQGEGVTIAILDTGIDFLHSAFTGPLSPHGYDFVDGDDDPTEVANGVDDDEDSLVDEGFGHGTMVAGIAALVAPEATILPIRALDDEGRTDSWTLVKAIHHAIANGADIINMSFGAPWPIAMVGAQLEAAWQAGITLVAAAGNEDRDYPPFYPASDDRVFMVTALDSVDVKADFADWNAKVLLSAPGTGVRSALPGDAWALGSGCSFATPFVTGEAALVLSLDPATSHEAMESRLEDAIDPIYHLPGNVPYVGELGTGRIYLPSALSGLVAVAGTPAGPGRGFAWPNPAPDGVRVRPGFAIEPSRGLTVTIHDLAGRHVQTTSHPAGFSPAAVRWDGRDRRGSLVPSGVYFVRITDGVHDDQVAVRIVR